MLITYGLLAADSESQYITFPFYADCENGTKQDNSYAVVSIALQWLQNKCLLKLSWFEIPSSAECSGSELFE